MDENIFDTVKIKQILPADGWYAKYCSIEIPYEDNEEDTEDKYGYIDPSCYEPASCERQPLACWAVVDVGGRDAVLGMDASANEIGLTFCEEDDAFVGYEHI